MKRWMGRTLLLAAVLALGVWLWSIIFPSPERVIRKKLAELAKSVSFGGNEAPVAKLANASRVAGFFTRDVEIQIEVPNTSVRSIQGREELFHAIELVRV